MSFLKAFNCLFCSACMHFKDVLGWELEKTRGVLNYYFFTTQFGKQSCSMRNPKSPSACSSVVCFSTERKLGT